MNKKITTQKRIRTTARNYLRNRAYKSSVKTAMKNSILSIKAMDYQKPQDAFLSVTKAFSRIDKSVKRKVMHKNKAARKKAFLSKLFNKKHVKVSSNLS